MIKYTHRIHIIDIKSTLIKVLMVCSRNMLHKDIGSQRAKVNCSIRLLQTKINPDNYVRITAAQGVKINSPITGSVY